MYENWFWKTTRRTAWCELFIPGPLQICQVRVPMVRDPVDNTCQAGPENTLLTRDRDDNASGGQRIDHTLLRTHFDIFAGTRNADRKWRVLNISVAYCRVKIFPVHRQYRLDEAARTADVDVRSRSDFFGKQRFRFKGPFCVVRIKMQTHMRRQVMQGKAVAERGSINIAHTIVQHK
ncbi:hypothetical protein SBC1_53570 (plasmid) [Caballeronia sp. SBC1]|nr:hypothetical protein SBC2_52790 [Caballeronia sp. SBC2]QIN65312.1 hypothetical protein SBC1_53570 [Caballeronia sp. SBC1]